MGWAAVCSWCRQLWLCVAVQLLWADSRVLQADRRLLCAVDVCGLLRWGVGHPATLLLRC